MALNAIRFLSLLCTAVSMSAGLAHRMELPRKIGMSAQDDLTVQQIYRGWPPLAARGETGSLAVAAL